MSAAEDKDALLLALLADRVGWVSERQLCLIFDMKPNAPKSKRQRGLWTEGVHWAKVDGQLRYNVEAIGEWIDRRACASMAPASKSASSIAGARSRARSISRPRLLV
jgi:hypothetical protein